jgi:parallel beta-helix repeat protein
MKSRIFFLWLVFFYCFIIGFCPTPLSPSVPIQSFTCSENSSITNTLQESVTINGNHDLLTQNWPGEGTFLSPYLIRNLSIEVTTIGALCIEIKNTNLYFSIQNCIFSGGESTTGISITNVTNGFVNQNEILTKGVGVNISSTTNILISNNKISGTQSGLVLSITSSLIIRDNLLANNSRAIASYYSTNNVILSNTITNTPTGGYGIEFSFSNNTLVSYNSIFNQNYGFYSDSSSNNNLTYNIFYGNYLKAIFITESGIGNTYVFSNDFYSPIKSISTGSLSQATDNGQNNVFSHNFWNEWLDPDDDADGIIDIPYLLAGFARNHDFFPLSTPNINTFAPPTTSSSSGWSFLTTMFIFFAIVIARRRSTFWYS